MPIDTARALALELDSFDVDVERGRLRAFAAAIGETDPVYTDVMAARAVGHPDLPAPPTFLFSLELDAPHPFGYLEELGVDLRGILHGEQAFTFHALAHAGDTVTVRPRIAEAFAKNDRMDFVVKHTDFWCGGRLLGEARALIVVRQVAAA